MLNLATLNLTNTASRSTARLRDAALARGHSITLLAALELTLSAGPGGLQLYRRGEPLPRFDAVIPRLSAASDPFGLAALQHLEAAGAAALNSAASIDSSHNKLHTLQRLAAAGIAVPPSTAVHRAADLTRAIDLVGGAPVIIKTVRGSQGIGVMLAESASAAAAIAETMLANALPIIVQRFFRESAGHDMRVFVVGDSVVAAMRRTAQDGEFRSNLHRGGAAAAANLSAEESVIAVRAAATLGLSIAGVDIIETDAGPCVLEVNSSPGLSGIEAATGVDIADAVIRCLEKMVEHQTTR